METTPTAYPVTLTEVERVEIAHALAFHWDEHPECRDELPDQYTIVCAVVDRLLRRRAKAAA